MSDNHDELIPVWTATMYRQRQVPGLSSLPCPGPRVSERGGPADPRHHSRRRAVVDDQTEEDA
jgi:hypothetical protein